MMPMTKFSSARAEAVAASANKRQNAIARQSMTNLPDDLQEPHLNRKGRRPSDLAPRRTAFGARSFATHMVMASLTHFLTNDISAAPCSFLSAACASQAVFSHLVMKL